MAFELAILKLGLELELEFEIEFKLESEIRVELELEPELCFGLQRGYKFDLELQA